jgi:hypothetical protein
MRDRAAAWEPDPGYPTRGADAVEKSQLQRRRASHDRALHRRRHRLVQSGQRRSPAPAPLCAARATRSRLSDAPEWGISSNGVSISATRNGYGPRARRRGRRRRSARTSGNPTASSFPASSRWTAAPAPSCAGIRRHCRSAPRYATGSSSASRTCSGACPPWPAPRRTSPSRAS